MAVIGKIREKSTFLLIVVGGALMAFVLTDLFSSRGSVFGGDLENIGSIDGVDIRGIEFEDRLQREIENYKTRENTSEVPEFIQTQLRDQVWNQYLNEYIMDKQIEEAGVAVSTEELGDMAYGDNPHPQVRQAFTNPETGVFNKNDVINFLKNMERDETGKAKQQWLVFEKAMKAERRQTKYYNLISKGLYATEQEAIDMHSGMNKRMNISFIAKRYNTVEDSTVQVSESDIRNYYEEHENDYIEKKSRKIEYAIFNIIPSSEDSAAIKAWVDETYADFKKTKDDSAFVNANSDREFDYKFYSKNDENPRIDTALYAHEAGYMEEPKIEAGFWEMVKISKVKNAPDSVSARHILLSYDANNKEEVLAKVDSLKKAVQAGADFAELAGQFSVDPGSKDKGGDLGWFKEGYMIPVINDSCFKAEVNKLMVIESPFGIHLIEVTAKSPEVKKLQVALIYRSIDASRETIDELFTMSNNFSLDAAEGKEFKELMGSYNVMYNEIDVRENDNMIPEVESSRGLIRWAYNAEIGQVSEAMQFGDAFVVAKLLEVHEDGVAPLENVRDQAELGAIREKKAEMFIEEMSGYTDLQTASTELKLPIETAENVVFESFSVPVLGREPNILGKVYTMEGGDLSVPLKGNSGVYIIRVDQVEDALPNKDYSAIKLQISQGRASRVNYEVFEALKERVDVEDNRYKFY